MIASLPLKITPPESLIAHSDKIVLVGSCFTEHISKRFKAAKFSVLENPNGILFNPISVVKSIESWIFSSLPEASSLFQNNEIWNHWDFHSRFSHFEKETALDMMQSSITAAHHFLKEADWLIITLGSAFQYFLKTERHAVANCHRMPAQIFDKQLLSIQAIEEHLAAMTQSLHSFNPHLKIIYTVSPVRHIRDGVIENNRSKARLLEAVHSIVDANANSFYFPAYELVIDVLRDYRYYDVDMVHPNFAATNAVWEVFYKNFLSEEAQTTGVLMQEITTASRHKVNFPQTKAYHQFRETFLQKIQTVGATFPYVNFDEEIRLFKKFDVL